MVEKAKEEQNLANATMSQLDDIIDKNPKR